MDNNDHVDYYTILGVSQYAKYREIKVAYRRLALKYHPDRNSSPFAEDIIKRINAAFEILSDKDKRRQYDKEAVFNNIVHNKEKNQTQPYSPYTHFDNSNTSNDYDANLKKGNKNNVRAKSEKTTTTTNNKFVESKSRFQIIVEPTLCMAFGSCEILAPNVFVVEKDKMINPKARVESETGADFETIIAAAQTCPTKAIIIIDRYTGEQIYP
ncbi:MAG: DnaJ domain-containing protein [Thermoproteota archaeon]|nr:DnaJ domain-containing protein [Thermoproteota archaeon]